jgi:hypothetical protein
MRALIPAACVSLAALSLSGCGFDNYAKAEKAFMETADHVPASRLVVDSRNGSIEVVAVADRTDVSITGMVYCRGSSQAEADERLAATKIRVTREADQTLVVKPIFPDPVRGGDGARFVIEVPDATGAEIDTSNGKVIVRGLAGDLMIDTSNGRVDVSDHDGPAHMDTSNGTVTVTDVRGRVFIDTSNASVRVNGADGPVTVDTSNASVRVTDADGPVRVDTSNGSIEVTLAAEHVGPLDLDTSNASIRVAVGRGFEGRVNFKTSNASISVQDPLGRISSTSLKRSRGNIVVGQGGESSRVDTSNGRIVFEIKG